MRWKTIQQDDRVAFVAESHAEGRIGVFENAEDAKDGRGINRAPESFVVEADVAAGDGHVEGAAGLGDAINRLAELAHDFGLFGIAEIEAIRGGDGTRAGAGDVARGFCDGVHRAQTRRALAPAAIAVRGKRNRARRLLEAEHGRVAGAREDARIRANHVVVLLEDPALRGDGGRSEQAAEIFVQVRTGRSEFDERRGGFLRFRRSDSAIVTRAFLGDGVRGDFRNDAAIFEHTQKAIARDAADLDGVEAPFAEHLEDFAFAAELGDKEHALLRFAEHDFVGRHARFTLRDAREFDFDARAAAGGHFAGRAREARGAHILNRDDSAGAHGFEAGFEEKFFHEGIADLDVGALLLRLLAEFGGGEERGAVDAVAARLRSDVNHGIARAPGSREKQIFAASDAERERVDERIIGIARLEADFAADGGNAEAIAVIRDAADDAVEDAAIARGFFGRDPRAGRERAETERVEDGNGACAHGENVAEDAADARRGALKRLDETRMIVRLDFENGDEAVADVHNAGIFARALDDARARGRQALEMHFAGFIGAVLAPHHAENAEFRDGGISAEDFLHAGEFIDGEAVFGGDFGIDFYFRVEHGTPLFPANEIVNNVPIETQAVGVILQRDALVISVDALIVVTRDGERLEAVAGDVVVTEGMRIGEAGVNGLHHAGARIELMHSLFDGGVKRRIRGRNGRRKIQDDAHANRRVVDDGLDLRDPAVDRPARQEAAIEFGAGFGRDDVDLLRALEASDGNCVRQPGENVRALLEKIVGVWLIEKRFDIGETSSPRLGLIRSMSAHHGLDGRRRLKRRAILADAFERGDQVIRRGIRDRNRGVAGAAGGGELQPSRSLLR